MTGPRDRLLSRLASVLACPACKRPVGPPAADGPAAVCAFCGGSVVRRGGQFVAGGLSAAEIEGDWLNRLKESAKRRLGRCYPAAIELLSPVLGRLGTARFLGSFDLENELVVDLGSGTSSYGDRVVCVDGIGYPAVHVVSDLRDLPFRDGSVSGVLSVAVLEHVDDPSAHVGEIRRVLRPGGRVLCFVPFIQGFHASPFDYQRLTHQGLRRLFDGFEVIETRVGAGPTSGLLWVVQEWLALVLSLGSRRLYRLILPMTWALSPLKYLDLLLARHPDASVIASGHTILARKPDPAEASRRELPA